MDSKNLIFFAMSSLLYYGIFEWGVLEYFNYTSINISLIESIYNLIFGFAGIYLFFILQKLGIVFTGIQCDTKKRQAVEVRIND